MRPLRSLGVHAIHAVFFNFAHDGSSAAGPFGSGFCLPGIRRVRSGYLEGASEPDSNLGLRYSLERPVYEKNGFEVQPTMPLGTNTWLTLAAANQGRTTSPIHLDKSGPANGGKPMYNWDKNNFQPGSRLPWTPDNGKTSFRGGFAMTNDYFGQALAVDLT